MKWLSARTLNQKLALAALIFGGVAIFARPTAGPIVEIDPLELAIMVQRGADRIAPLELADWLIRGRADYRLLDLRDAGAFAVYHVPTAQNVPLTALGDAEIPANELVVLYGDDGVKSAQAWFLLRARGGRGVYMLSGGIEGWKQQVLYPVVEEGMAPERAAKLRAVSEHFGGAVMAAAGTAKVVPAPPAIQPQVPPPAPGANRTTPPKPKKKEGC